MTRTVEVQPWTTLHGGSGSEEIIQELPDWLDCSKHDMATVTVQLTQLSSADLLIEGSDEIGGSFNTLYGASAGSISSDLMVLSLARVQAMGTMQRLYNFLRWRVKPSGSPWCLSFKITAALK